MDEKSGRGSAGLDKGNGLLLGGELLLLLRLKGGQALHGL
jgi:hypothetical protein